MSSPSQAASDPNKSAWVAANAGAGKTYTLANRVTRLLLQGAKPQRILCLTFTKAAAAEMQDRLFRQLGEWSMLPDDKLRAEITGIGAVADNLPKARRLFAQALETPGGLKVLTIHAFCQIVLSRFPIEAGVAPGFEVMDEQTARAMIAQARAVMLERAGRGDPALGSAVAHLASEISEATLNSILNAALSNDRRKLDRFFASLESEDFSDAVWRGHGAQKDEDIPASFCSALKHDIEILKQAKALLAGGTSTDAGHAAMLAVFLQSNFSAAGFDALRSYFHTREGEPRSRLMTTNLRKTRPDLLDYLTNLQQRFCQAEDRRRAAYAAGLAHAALTLIAAVRGEYATAKMRRGLLDYDDLILRTLGLLKRSDAAAWVLYKLDGGLDHVLIDEAQDTSPEQWEIVNLLTEEFFTVGKNRTLFAVGDEKQSIFSFQGADPAQFDINRTALAERAAQFGHPFLDQALTTSRRSTPEILKFVDTVFENEAARAGLNSHGEVIEHDAHRATDKGGVEFWTALPVLPSAEVDHYRPVDVLQPGSPVLSLAEKIADTIRHWLNSHIALPGHEQAIAPKDIMILLPRREPFGSEIIRQLKLRGIAVAGADRVRLTEQMAVMDLMALGRFVLQRDDELNLASLLRSPLCGLSEDDLFQLCHGRPDGLWQSLKAHAAEKAFEPAYIFLSEMLERADYAPPFEFYSHALTARDKKRALLARLGPESGDAIEEFLSLSLNYERGQTPSLQTFLHWLAQGGTEIKRDMERGRNEVRVMTVHGAKGLEADIVILPDTTTLPDPPSCKGHLLYGEGSVLFPVAEKIAPPAVKAAKEAELLETLNEHRRLLYVALTRARDRLYVCGFENQRGIADGSWYRLAEEAAQKLGRTIKRGEDDVRAFGTVDEETRAPRPADAQPQGVAAPWLKRSAPVEQLRPRLIRPSDAAEAQQGASLSPLEGAKRFRRGTVAHTMLARLPELAPDKRRDAAMGYSKANGFDESLADEVLAVISHPDFAAVFAPSSQAEVAFQAELPDFGDNALVTGRIDRLAVTKDEVLILDYKTNRPPPSREEDVDPVYLAQMALYRAGAARIFPGRRIVCGLVWTDGPSLLRLSDAILDRQIAGMAARLDPEGGRS